MDPPLALFVLSQILGRDTFDFTKEICVSLASLHTIETWICSKFRRFVSTLDHIQLPLTDLFLFLIPSFFHPRVGAELSRLLHVGEVHNSDAFALRSSLPEFCSSEAIQCGNSQNSGKHCHIFGDGGQNFPLAAPRRSSGSESTSVHPHSLLNPNESGHPAQTQPDDPARSPRKMRRRRRPLVNRVGDGEIDGSGQLLTLRLLTELRRGPPAPMRSRNVAILEYQLSGDGIALSTLIGKSVELFRTETRIWGAAFEGSLTAALAMKWRFVQMGLAIVFASDSAADRLYRRKIPENTSLDSVESGVIILGGPKPTLCLSHEFRNLRSAECGP
jgi:hypothetical protein